MIPSEVKKVADTAQSTSQKIVLVTGVFDVLHPKHIEFLQNAKAKGDVLIVGIETDVRVKQIKGPERPYYSEKVRLENLQRLHIADVVFLLPEDFGQPAQREALIQEVRPAFLAISSHSSHQPEKQALLQKYGGQVVVVTQYDPHFSSTQLIAEMKKNKGAV